MRLHAMRDPQSLECYRKQLQEISGGDRGQYLAKTAESAEAVSPDKGLGRLSRMEAMQDQQLILAARRRKKMQKVEVLSALQTHRERNIWNLYILRKTDRS